VTPYFIPLGSSSYGSLILKREKADFETKVERLRGLVKAAPSWAALPSNDRIEMYSLKIGQKAHFIVPGIGWLHTLQHVIGNGRPIAAEEYHSNAMMYELRYQLIAGVSVPDVLVNRTVTCLPLD
jgi:hypothetical protein